MKKHPILFSILFLVVIGLVLYFVDINPRWSEPRRLVSKDGVLDVSLDASNSEVEIGGVKQKSMVYNGEYLGDTWEISPGDTVRVHLKNDLDQTTNLHFHGSHVSPKGNSDHVLLTIDPGETFDYEYKLPSDHPPGLYWYHPHMHPYAEGQVLGGMAGAIKVRGGLDELPGVKGVPERLLVLTTQDPSNSDTTVRLVNNKLSPTLYLRPFETVRLEFLNASADDFYNLSIPGYKLNIISRDGNTLSKVVSVDSEVMAPGDRIQVLFQPKWWGDIEVKSLPYNAGTFEYPEDTFMHIKVSGVPRIPTSLPTTLLPHDDLRDAPVVRTRTLTFTEGGTSDNPTYMLDGQVFDPDEISQVMTLDTTEQWNLVNESDETHPFHIHVNPFQVLSLNGEEIERYGYDDTFPVPANSTVVMKTRYKDFDGKFVLHCHILFHEDHGMMQVVEIVKPGASTASDNGLPEREGMLDAVRHMQMGH